MLNYFRLKSLVPGRRTARRLVSTHHNIMVYLGFRVLVQRRPPSHPPIVLTRGLKSEITLWSVARASHLEARVFEQRTAPLARDMSAVIAFCCFRWVFNAYNVYTYTYSYYLLVIYTPAMCLCSRNCSSTFMAQRLYYYYYLLFILSGEDKNY